jgi:hypothetical protein
VVINIKRAKHDAALARRATCFLWQCRNRIGKIVPASDTALVG